MVFKFGKSLLAATVILGTLASGLAYTYGTPAAVAATPKTKTTKVAAKDNKTQSKKPAKTTTTTKAKTTKKPTTSVKKKS